MTKLALTALAGLALLTACNKGPAEQAGENIDNQNPTTASVLADGPAENAGENIDQATGQAPGIAMDSTVTAQDGAEAQADAVRDAGDAKADAMVTEANKVQERAETKADTIEERADSPSK